MHDIEDTDEEPWFIKFIDAVSTVSAVLSVVFLTMLFISLW